MLRFQFRTHCSLQDSKASHYFQTVTELRLSVHNFCHSKPRPFAQIKIDTSAHVQILIAWKCTFGNRGFNNTALLQGAMIAVKPSGTKQELRRTTRFINTIMLDVWGQSWNTEEEEEATYSMPRTGPTPGSALFCLCCCCVYICICNLDQTWVRSLMSSMLQLSLHGQIKCRMRISLVKQCWLLGVACLYGNG